MAISKQSKATQLLTKCYLGTATSQERSEFIKLYKQLFCIDLKPYIAMFNNSDVQN